MAMLIVVTQRRMQVVEFEQILQDLDQKYSMK